MKKLILPTMVVLLISVFLTVGATLFFYDQHTIIYEMNGIKVGYIETITKDGNYTAYVIDELGDIKVERFCIESNDAQNFESVRLAYLREQRVRIHYITKVSFPRSNGNCQGNQITSVER